MSFIMRSRLDRLCGTALVICVIVWTYWLWLDNPQVYTRNIVTVDNPNDIHPGGVLLFTKDICVTREPIPKTAHRWITNTYLITIADSSQQGAVGCSVTKRVIPIPSYTLFGPHKYYYKAEFRINPLKTEVIENPPFDFMVTPDPDNPEPNNGDQGLRGATGPEGQTGRRGPAGD